jgi:membrane protein
MKEKIALLAMYHIGKNFHENRDPWTSSELSDVLNISSEALSEVLHTLECDKLLTRHQDRDISYLPGQSLENIFVIRILESARNHSDTSCATTDFIHSEKTIDDLMLTIDTAIDKRINKLSLRDLITTSQLDFED